MKRRTFSLGVAAAAGATCGLARGASPRRDDPLRLGLDHVLVRAGQATRIQHGFFKQTGLAVQLVPGASAAVLDALEAGDLDASLTLAPDLEARLEQQGLAYDRHPVMQLEFVIAGPLQGKAGDPARLRGTSDASSALALLAAGSIPFLGHNGGSGAHLLEQSLWRAAHVAPTSPWFRQMEAPDGDELALAAHERRYVLTDRARWSAGGVAGMGALVQGDPRLLSTAQLLRAFRRPHPSGKLFVSWLTGPHGQALFSGPGVRGMP
jgi:tungstate transport system substrate-binding protein